LNDKTLNRLIRVLVAIIAVGVPTIGLIYYLDRHVDSGPSIAGRTVIAAEEAVRQNPNALASRIVLAQAYEADRRPADAIEQYTVVLEAQPANTVALLGRADLYRRAGQLDPAKTDYLALIEIAKTGEMAGADRSLAAAYFGMGAILFVQDKPREAATQLANALSIERTDADALDLMGQALMAIGDYPNAVDALSDAVAFVPTGWPDPYAHLAQAYEALGDDAGAAYAKGMVALCEGRAGDAHAALLPLVDGAHAREALTGLGLTAEQLGDPAAASDYYQRVLAIAPDDFAAQTGLGRVGIWATDAPRTSAPLGSNP
jgi:tetratricopeptide (TPR) repeat protein